MSDKAGGASYIGSAITTVIGAVTFDQWMMLGGFLLGVGTFAFNACLKLRDDRRKERVARAQIEAAKRDAEETEE